MISRLMRWATKPAGHWRKIPSFCGPALLLLLGGVSPHPKVTSAAQIPTPGLPTPGLPTPGVPAPGVPAPVVPTPVVPTPGLPTPGVPVPGVPPQDPETLRRQLAEESGLYSAEISPIDNRATGPPEYFEREVIEEEAIEGGVLGNELPKESWLRDQIWYDIPRV
ncbi:MAG: hypothetical protein VYE53_08515 [Planctomycetota bacterium]|nr:hypothetical protein [Planctomycetota bacterium]